MSARPLTTMVLAAVAALAVQHAYAMPIRSIDGSSNNAADSTQGATGTTLIRLTPNAYEDGVGMPRGDDPRPLPSARAVSNAVAGQSRPIYNQRGASDWLWQWGQFLDHDMDLTETAQGTDPFNIAVPLGDPQFDPGMSGTAEIPMQRSLYEPVNNVREQVNEITAYIDASQVYGSTQDRAEVLRGTGSYLRMTDGANGEILLGRNAGGYPNAEMGPAPSSEFFLAGDVRANEQIGLTATHTLFAREHNRLVDELNARIALDDPVLIAERDATIAEAGNGVDNETDFVFEAARKIVGAQIQKITYAEFLPVLLGVDLTSAYSSYDGGVDAGISTEFSTAAFRVGHTMLPSSLLRVDETGTQPLALRDAFFNPGEVFTNGVDSLLHGLATRSAQQIDTLLVDDVRNFLFGPPGSGGFDLASLNIQRGRDHGVDGINAIRTALGLMPYADFLGLTGGDAALADAFGAVYAHIDDVDLWIGGLAENAAGRSMLGETFTEILTDQFMRSMIGDRFFYLSELDTLQRLDRDFMSTTLSGLITRNSSVTSLQANVFRVPEPRTTALFVTALLLIGLQRRSIVPTVARAA